MARRNWIDSFVSFCDPKRGAIRARARLAEQYYLSAMQKRSYDGASIGRRTGTWFGRPTSANAEIRGALRLLRDRSRDLVRNDSHATKAVRVLATNIVGAGIVPRFRSESPKKKQLQTALWKSWAESLRCAANERNTFYGLQALIMRTVVESGECLIRRRRAKAADGLPVPLQIEVLEPDYIDSLREELLPNGGFIIQGIEYDNRGRRVAYWLFENHPGEYSVSRLITTRSNRVPASEIIHVFEELRAGQVRGIPWFAPAIVTLKDHSDFHDATLLRQKLAACFTAFIQDAENIGDLPGGADGSQDVSEKLEPGAIERLPPGKTIVFPEPPSVVSFNDVDAASLRKVAAGLGITYESLTGDYSRVNFSSGRMGWLEFQRALDPWRWHMFIPHACVGVFEWFVESAMVAGELDEAPDALWIPPRREMIDPTREVPAQIQAIRGGVTTLHQVISENGEDPDEVLAEIEATNEQLDGMGIVLDSDPRKTQKAGGLQMGFESNLNDGGISANA